MAMFSKRRVLQQKRPGRQADSRAELCVPNSELRVAQTVQGLLATRPPVPVQLVWKNSPRGL
jgi:hypothetical protein